MSSNVGWLLNNVNSASVKTNEFEVTAGVTRLFGANLGNDIPIQVWVGGDDIGSWVPLARNGKAIVMNDLNNSYIEMVAGSYRVDGSNAGPNAQIWFEENFATDGDDRTIYVFNNVSGESNSSGGGLSSVTTGTGNNTVVFSGSGTITSPLTAQVKLSTSDNLITTVSDGLVATVVHTDSQTVSLTGDGSSASPLEAFAKVSATTGNSITVNSDGLYVSGSLPLADLQADGTLLAASPIFNIQYSDGVTTTPATTNINTFIAASNNTLYFETIANGASAISANASCPPILTANGHNYALAYINAYNAGVTNKVSIIPIVQAQQLNVNLSDGSSTPISMPIIIQSSYVIQ